MASETHTAKPWTPGGRVLSAVRRAEDSAGTMPAKDAVKLWPADWHTVCDAARGLVASHDDLVKALEAAVRVAEEARKEWDAAPSGMKAGKLLIALGGGLPGYRSDIDAIHAALAKARATRPSF